MQRRFSPGDVVRLKSGGPAMTVESYLTCTERYSCVWWSSVQDKCVTAVLGGDLLEYAVSMATYTLELREPDCEGS